MAQLCYIFRIQELRQTGSVQTQQDASGQWIPEYAPENNIIVAAGATNVWWHCDGSQIRILENEDRLVRRASLYKSYSMFFSNGRAFSVMRGNASSPHDEVWFPLSFDHDRRTYSSYLTNARFEPALLCFRSDQRWVNMLLPDIYHGRYVVPPPYGGLKGDLAIFLALIAFAIPMDRLQQDLPAMFHTGAWQQYEMGNGRDHQRGVVVEIWTYPGRYGGSSTDDIVAFEENGMYYP